MGAIMPAVVITGTGEQREEGEIGTITQMDDMKNVVTIVVQIGRPGLAGQVAVAGS